MNEVPAVTITGNHPVTERVSTGIYTMDVALGDPRKRALGMPLRTYYEIYGNQHQGKSTLSYYLSSKIGGDRVEIADFEGFDKDYLQACYETAGYSGEVHIIDAYDEKKKKLRTHNAMIQEMITTVGRDGTCRAGIWDSVGSYVPVAEGKGDIGDAIIGKRAKDIAQACRRMLVLKSLEDPSAVFVVNHVHSIIGGRGHSTPGGDTLKYLAGVRIFIWSKAITVGEDKLIIGYEISGTVEKLKFGGKGRKFTCVNLAGYGISPELSAMFDCFKLGLAERSTKVKIGDKSIDYISKLFEAARDGKKERFEPFFAQIEKRREEDDFVYDREEE